MPTDDKPISVTALTQRITHELEDFGTLCVLGELSQVKVAPSGHLYATLKDSQSVISLVMWRSQVVRNGRLPREGDQVVVLGSLSVYGPRGQYQLAATRITQYGQGDLAARFEALKTRLQQEGLFADGRKRALPWLPRAIGLATASGSAALADVLHSLRSRFPRMPIVHAPCLVQGQGAVMSIQAALRRLDAHPAVDVIILARGGGSLEDLWAFNEEAVVRAIAACIKPVISAIGHETDHTLADFVADVRAKTPTAAGELVVPMHSDLLAVLADSRLRLDAGIAALVRRAAQRLHALTSHRALAGPAQLIALRRQRLDDLRERLDDRIARRVGEAVEDMRVARTRLAGAGLTRRLERERERLLEQTRQLARGMRTVIELSVQRLAAAAGRLDALSPLGVIARGFSVVRRSDGLLVRRMDQVAPGNLIHARMADGWIEASVTGNRPLADDERPLGGLGR